MDVSDIVQKVTTIGYAVCDRFEPQLSTEEVALRLGSIMDVSSILPNVPKVQTLRPRQPTLQLMNQYSGTYGTQEFPWHTDLAHWYLPPRYLMLRCKVGTKNVATNLISYSNISSAIGERSLKQALVVPRRKRKEQILCPLPVIFSCDEQWGIRWDFLFLSPLNESAKNIYETLASHYWHGDEIVSATLLEPGDTIIIDNWKMLHSRSAVPEESIHREIERIYLNKLGVL